MPFAYNSTRNVTTPVPTSVPTTEARIARIHLVTNINPGSSDYSLQVEVYGGRLVSGNFVPIEAATYSFDNTETLAILGGGLGVQLEQALLTAMRSVGKLPPGSVV